MAAAAHHGLTMPAGAGTLVKGGWLGGILHTYPSEMAQNFWTAIWAWTVCFVATIVISLATRRDRSDADLAGLVYSLTPRIADEEPAWWRRPAPLGAAVLVASLALNLWFW
jgi:SSS family solute:Na+ symporter